MWFQTFVADLRFQARLCAAGRQLRPPPRGLLPLVLVQVQPLGLQLPLPAHGPLPEVGVGPSHPDSPEAATNSYQPTWPPLHRTTTLHLQTDPLRSSSCFISYVPSLVTLPLLIREIRIENRDLDFSSEIFLDLLWYTKFRISIVSFNDFRFLSVDLSLVMIYLIIRVSAYWLGNYPALLPNQYALTPKLGQSDPDDCFWRRVLGRPI